LKSAFPTLFLLLVLFLLLFGSFFYVLVLVLSSAIFLQPYSPGLLLPFDVVLDAIYLLVLQPYFLQPLHIV